jgi:hypothetical protein
MVMSFGLGLLLLVIVVRVATRSLELVSGSATISRPDKEAS